MAAVIIHGENKDTALFINDLAALEGIRHTVVEYDGSTEYMRDRDDIKKQFQDLIDEVMGILGFRRGASVDN